MTEYVTVIYIKCNQCETTRELVIAREDVIFNNECPKCQRLTVSTIIGVKQ